MPATKKNPKPPAIGPSFDPLALDNQLCFALYSASLAMTKAYKPWLDALGLTYPQYLVMLVLWEHGSLSVSELGERLYLDSGTLTPLLKRMEGGGVLQRVRSVHDERRVQVSPTPAGRKLKARAAKIPECMLQSTGCRLDELLALTASVRRLREGIRAA
jgi:MarR family transcriptional regulator, organic hydroperoxide resistance regulator